MSHVAISPDIVETFKVTCNIVRIPIRTGKPGKWEGIFQSGKSLGILNRLEKSGKMTSNTGKHEEFQILFVIFQ